MIAKLTNLLQMFRDILPTRNMEELEQRLARAQEREDLSALSKIYYDMGVHCMKNNDPNRAMMYLSRSDSIFSSRDDIYEHVKKSLREDCSKRIGELEEFPLLTNQIPEEIEQLAEQYLYGRAVEFSNNADSRALSSPAACKFLPLDSLDDLRIRLWGLLTMSRLVQVGNRLSVLEGCEVLGELGTVTDLILRSFQEPITQEQYKYLLDVCNQLYDLSDDECFSDMTKQAAVPGGAPIQAFDLNGLLTLTELNLYIDSHLRLLAGGPDNSDAETGLIACALLPDYYLRICREDLSRLPQIQNEIDRIQSDLDFVYSPFTWQDIAGRAAAYKNLDILLAKPQ